MSKENVVLFSRAINTKAGIDESVSQHPVLQQWIKIAEDAGFEFSEGEFCAVFSVLFRASVTPQNAAQEYLRMRQEVGRAELTRRLEQTFIGGAHGVHFTGWFGRCD